MQDDAKQEAPQDSSPSQKYEAVPVSAATQEQASNWKYSDETPNDVAPAMQPFSWTASEFIAHAKGAGWYFTLAAGTVVLAAAVYFLTSRDEITTGMIVIVAILFGIMAARKPRELQYEINETGIRVGEKFYPFGSFKSFSVVREVGVDSIWFMPLERFRPGLSIYFAPQDGPKIVDVLSQVLPVESRELDPLDRLMHKVRF